MSAGRSTRWNPVAIRSDREARLKTNRGETVLSPAPGLSPGDLPCLFLDLAPGALAFGLLLELLALLAAIGRRRGRGRGRSRACLGGGHPPEGFDAGVHPPAIAMEAVHVRKEGPVSAARTGARAGGLTGTGPGGQALAQEHARPGHLL